METKAIPDQSLYSLFESDQKWCEPFALALYADALQAPLPSDYENLFKIANERLEIAMDVSTPEVQVYSFVIEGKPKTGSAAYKEVAITFTAPPCTSESI